MEGHKIPLTKEMKGKKYFKWHNRWSHTTNNYLVFRNVIQKSIIKDRLKFPNTDKGFMLIDGDPYPKVAINITSANLTNMKLNGHGQSVMQKLESIER